jgi:serine/threonine-protein kinase
MATLTEALLLDPSCKEARVRMARLAADRLKIALFYGRRSGDYAEARRWMGEAARHNTGGIVDEALAVAGHELEWKRQILIQVSPAGVEARCIEEDPLAGTRGEEGPVPDYLPPGRYILVLRCEGYVPTQVPLHVAPVDPGTIIGPLIVRFAMVPAIPSLEGMVFVPEGKFLFGGPGGLRGGYTREELAQSFFIDRTEVTNAQYAAFLEDLKKTGDAAAAARTPATFADPRLSRSELPVVGISWEDAKAYAAWAGKRLPTQREWEKAARGVDGRLYPWGDRFDETRCVHHLNPALSVLSPAGSVPEGASPFGCLDMAGNAAEWTADDFYGYPIVRGGSHTDPFDILRTNAQDCVYPTSRAPTLGFRCACDLK